jgi:hypothetical protein
VTTPNPTQHVDDSHVMEDGGSVLHSGRNVTFVNGEDMVDYESKSLHELDTQLKP